MKRFRFRLRALERLREVRAREAAARLARALATTARIDRQLREVERAVDQSPTGAPDLGEAGEAREWKRQATWRADGRAATVVLRERARAARATARELAQTYETALQGQRVLERLHERRRREWQAENDREETRWLAENHAQRARRGSGDEETRR